MDKSRLLEPFGLSSESKIYFQHLELIFWGRSLNFVCYALNEQNNQRHFNLIFADCRDIRWQHYSHIPLDDKIKFPTTELVNFSIGRDQHRSPCRMLTEHFGLSLFYGELKLLPVDD